MVAGKTCGSRGFGLLNCGIMDWLEEILVQCPQCGEEFAIQIETAVDGTVVMIEDCAVCCRPATVRITTAEGEVRDVQIDAA